MFCLSGSSTLKPLDQALKTPPVTVAPCILKKTKTLDPYGVSIEWLSALWNAL